MREVLDVKVLGVNPSKGDLWVALYGDHGPELTDPVKLSLHDGPEGGYALSAFRTTAKHTLSQWSPDLIVILNSNSPQGGVPWSSALPRVSAETMLVLAATDCNMRILRITHAQVRKGLSIDRTGGLREHAKRLLPDKVGTHWAGKRDLAALAAASKHPKGLDAC